MSVSLTTARPPPASTNNTQRQHHQEKHRLKPSQGSSTCARHEEHSPLTGCNLYSSSFDIRRERTIVSRSLFTPAAITNQACIGVPSQSVQSTTPYLNCPRRPGPHPLHHLPCPLSPCIITTAICSSKHTSRDILPRSILLKDMALRRLKSSNMATHKHLQDLLPTPTLRRRSLSIKPSGSTSQSTTIYGLAFCSWPPWPAMSSFLASPSRVMVRYYPPYPHHGTESMLSDNILPL